MTPEMALDYSGNIWDMLASILQPDIARLPVMNTACGMTSYGGTSKNGKSNIPSYCDF
jgi:hypothetical protein